MATSDQPATASLAPSAPPRAPEDALPAPSHGAPASPVDDELLLEEERAADAVEDAQDLVENAFRHHDPSHDYRHVHRVRLMALSLTQDAGLRRPADRLVVELAALFHDMVDRKYLPATATDPVTASRVLGPFLEAHAAVLGPERSQLICRIVDNVSWSKDQARRAARRRAQRAGGEPISAMDQAAWEWEQSCVEYQLVSDADRLDAIGSIGIMRCAAFAASRNSPLHVPPKNSESTSAPPYEQSEGYSSSAIAHFYSKLVHIRGDNLWTETARKEAERRQQVMNSFLTEIDLEWLVAEQGALYSHTGLW